MPNATDDAALDPGPGAAPRDTAPGDATIRTAIRTADLGRAFRVGVRLRRQLALEDVSFAVPAGSTLGLVGPNGSGKSTLLRILAGVDRPTAGGLTVLGGSPSDRDVRRRLAFLPDGTPFPPELTARAALDLVASLDGMPRGERRRRVPAMLERVDLKERSATRLRAFSRGMHRRFGLAQAFLGEPELVLLDEPTAGLDAPGFGVLEGLLGEARARRATIVLASHVPADLVDHCDHVLLLRRGRVERSGTPDDLFGRDDLLDLRVECRADDPTTLARLQGAIEGAGARVVRARRARRSLLEFYGDAPENRSR